MIETRKPLLAALLLFGFIIGQSATITPAKGALESNQVNAGRTIYLPAVANGCAACLYVNGASGSDANPGTSPGRAWKTIQKAASTATPGMTVYVAPGLYRERVQITRSGTAQAPIIFTSDGRAILRGFTIKASFITVRGFEITDTPDDWQDGWGIFIRGRNNLVEKNYVHDATHGGIVLWAPVGQETNTQNTVVRGNRLYHNATAGVEVQGRDNRVEGNEIWGTIQYHPKWANPPSTVDADGILFFGSGHVIRGNSIHDITYTAPENVNPHIDCFQTWGSSNYEAGHDLVIEQNFCKNLEAQSLIETGKGFRIENAYNLTIRNNIILAYVLFDMDDTHDVQVVNNTFSNSPYTNLSYYPAGIVATNPTRLTVLNNIFYNVGGNIKSYLVLKGTVSGITAGYNLAYMSNGRNPGGTPYPNDLWQVNPLFINADAFNFHLQNGSPAINAGTALANPADYENNPRPVGQGYDIGAFEKTAP